MQAVRVVLSVALGSLYSFLIFAGIGLWMPLIFLPVIFLACCLSRGEMSVFGISRARSLRNRW